MKQFDFRKATYNVSGITHLSLDEALKLWRTKFETLEHFRRGVIKSPAMQDFFDFVTEVWESIEMVTIQEAFQQKNAEMRRVYFECIGVVKIFQDLQPEMVDRQVIKKKRAKWDSDNKESVYIFEDIYELYRIPAAKLFGDIESNRFGRIEDAFVYAVRCWCTSTAREYWLYCDDNIAMTDEERKKKDRDWSYKPKKFDAIKAIAWTIRLGITNPEKIYRQGDVVIAKASESSKEISLYHLNKKQYLELMYSES